MWIFFPAPPHTPPGHHDPHIYVKKTPVAITCDPQNRMRAKAYAAKTLMAMDSATTQTVTIIVFLKKVRKSVSVSRFL